MPRPVRQQGCQGCGWPIRNDMADDGVERVHYCRICDPTGRRESIRDEAERETWVEHP